MSEKASALESFGAFIDYFGHLIRGVSREFDFQSFITFEKLQSLSHDCASLRTGISPEILLNGPERCRGILTLAGFICVKVILARRQRL
jgi:hypothetical protein